MKPLIKIVFLLVILMMASNSCRKIEEFPPEPWIQFLAFEKILNPVDSVFDRGVLKFEYRDGDGDLGLAKKDTLPPFNFGSKYYYNLIIDFYELRNGVETRVPLTFYNPETEQFDTIPLSARIPKLVPSGAVKSISGDIYDTLFMFNYNSDFDTLFFKFYIIDRALNESNQEVTPYIIRKFIKPSMGQ